MSQMTLEDLVAKIPEVQRVIADDLQRKRDAITEQRAKLIDQAAELDAKTPMLEAMSKKKAEATEKARQAFENVRGELWEAEQELADVRSKWGSCQQLLRQNFGNMAVDSAACRVNAYLCHLGNREQALVGKAAEVHTMGPFTRLKYPEAAAELKAIREQITNAREAARELEALMSAKGHPDEIAAAAEAIVARVLPDDETN